MNILACVKRVPATGAKIVLTADEQAIETRNLGFAVSPHEECGVEEAIRLKEAHGGTATVLTLGPAEAAEQLRFALAQGMDRAVLLETDGGDWPPRSTAQAIVEAITAQQAEHGAFDVLIFGNESADAGGYQVGIRVAQALDLPCVTGVKSLKIDNGTAIAKKEMSGGWEVYEVPLPAVFTVKEGLNLPRYPSLPGRLRAKKAKLEQSTPQKGEAGLEKIRLKVPTEQHKGAEILGQGAAAAPKIVEILKKVGVLQA
jgi:electron transfer flavoprotein beta subunit